MKNRLIKRIVSGLAAAAVLLSLAACSSGTGSSSAAKSSGGKEGKSEFVYGLTTQPSHMDPYLSTSADTREILFNVFEGLVKPDKDGNLKPAVAESYTISSDALTYTFKLRKGVKFHNGSTVTAGDVKYSLDKAAGLSGGKAMAADLADIRSVGIADSSTVKVNLKKPDYDFLPYLTIAITPKGYTEQDTHPIGTGPYRFVSYTPQQSLILKKNPNYWQKGLPHLDTIVFKLEANSNALLTGLQGGSVDGASVTESTASQLSGGFSIVPSNSNSVQMLALNNKKKPFDNREVRQAVSYAVDPDAVIKTVNFGKGVRCGTPVIPGLKQYCDTSLTHAYDHNTAKAKELLAKAGYPDGFSMTITVPSNYAVHVDTAQVIVNELKEAGIQARIEQVDFATWLSKCYEDRDYQSTVISVDGAALSPRSFLSRYVSADSKNFVNYSSGEFDGIYKKAAAEKDEKKRVELYMQAQRQLSKDAASVYIEDISSLNAFRKGFGGYTAYPLYVFDASTIQYEG